MDLNFAYELCSFCWILVSTTVSQRQAFSNHILLQWHPILYLDACQLFLISYNCGVIFKGTLISVRSLFTNPLNAELNPICHLLELLGAHHILHVSRIRVNCQVLPSLPDGHVITGVESIKRWLYIIKMMINKIEHSPLIFLIRWQIFWHVLVYICSCQSGEGGYTHIFFVLAVLLCYFVKLLMKGLQLYTDSTGYVRNCLEWPSTV
jgi:hypothetical protein